MTPLDNCSNEIRTAIGVRANIHWGGGGRPSFALMDSVGGGVVADIFRARFGGGVVAELFPVTAVTDPKFLLFEHVLCFARIMLTLCPNVLSTNIPNWGGQLPHAPRPVRLCVLQFYIMPFQKYVPKPQMRSSFLVVGPNMDTPGGSPEGVVSRKKCLAHLSARSKCFNYSRRR